MSKTINRFVRVDSFEKKREWGKEKGMGKRKGRAPMRHGP